MLHNWVVWVSGKLLVTALINGRFSLLFHAREQVPTKSIYFFVPLSSSTSLFKGDRQKLDPNFVLFPCRKSMKSISHGTWHLSFLITVEYWQDMAVLLVKDSLPELEIMIIIKIANDCRKKKTSGFCLGLKQTLWSLWKTSLP